MIKWLENNQKDSDVIISSRIRLARNLKDMKFPHQMSLDECQHATEKILNGIKKASDTENINYKFYRTKDLLPLEREVFVENHLVSPELIRSSDKSSFLLRDDEKVTIMINEEDHIRIQILFPGLDLEESWKICNQVDDMLEQYLDYAFDEKLGYLTSCPTNVGTGLRASVMLHLPCLVITGFANSIFQAVNQIGLTVRGLYGEGSEALGNIFQISNQVTLGETEEEIIQKLKNVVNQIMNKERDIRNKFLETRKIELEDRIFKSYGLLKYSRIISSIDAMKFFSDVKMGIEMGIIKDISCNQINKLMIMIQPSNLQKYFEKKLTPKERDIKRAELIREKI